MTSGMSPLYSVEYIQHQNVNIVTNDELHVCFCAGESPIGHMHKTHQGTSVNPNWWVGTVRDRLF